MTEQLEASLSGHTAPPPSVYLGEKQRLQTNPRTIQKDSVSSRGGVFPSSQVMLTCNCSVRARVCFLNKCTHTYSGYKPFGL